MELMIRDVRHSIRCGGESRGHMRRIWAAGALDGGVGCLAAGLRIVDAAHLWRIHRHFSAAALVFAAYGCSQTQKCMHATMLPSGATHHSFCTNALRRAPSYLEDLETEHQSQLCSAAILSGSTRIQGRMQMLRAVPSSCRADFLHGQFTLRQW